MESNKTIGKRHFQSTSAGANMSSIIAAIRRIADIAFGGYPTTHSTPPKAGSSAKADKWLPIGFIVLAASVIYYNSLNAPFILDDQYKIERNPDIKQLSNLKTKLIYPYNKNYQYFNRNDPSRPLTYLTFALNYYFGKLNPSGYHFVNLLLHIINTILIFLLTKKIFFHLYKKDTHFVPLAVSLFFAVHPVNVSSVTYIFSRSDLLATLFYLLSLLLFELTFRKDKRIYFFSLLCFIFAMFSKQIAVTLPAIILVFDYIFICNSQLKEVFRKKYYHMPFWILLLSYLLFRYAYFGGIGDLEARAAWDRYSYIIIQPYIILKYIKLLLIPSGLCIDHTILPLRIADLKVITSFIILSGIFVLVYIISRKKNPVSRIMLFSALWFFIVLSPTSSFFPTTSVLVENRLYLSGFGFYLAFVFALVLIFSKNHFFGRPASPVMIVVILTCVTVFGILTMKRNYLFKDPARLWQDVISKYPDNSRAHNNLGLLYQMQEEYGKAIQEYRKAMEIQPDHIEALTNLGIIYQGQKEYDRAILEYKKALEIQPDFALAHNNLGVLYQKQKEYDRAIREYKKAMEIQPDFVEAHNNLGVLYQKQKEYDRAIREYKKAMEIQPDYIKAHLKLSALYLEQKQYSKAIREYEKILEIQPEYVEVHYTLGVLYQEQGEYAKALREYEIAIKLNPNYVDAYNKLGLTYALLKEYARAIEILNKTIGSNPRNDISYFNLGYAYTQKREYNKAIKSYNKAIELNPNLSSAYYNLGCIYALNNDKIKSLKNLKIAVNKDKNWKKEARKDKDFKKYWNDSDFLSLVK